jgi:hypothetical protein
MVGNICLDKDGVRGAAVWAEMAVYLNDVLGKNCNEMLLSLYEKYVKYI